MGLKATSIPKDFHQQIVDPDRDFQEKSFSEGASKKKREKLAGIIF